MAVLTGKPRSASVRAVEDSVVYIINKEDLVEIFKKYPRVREIIGLESVKREEENILSMLEDEE
jgi:CRP-like cAMP-binding protein